MAMNDQCRETGERLSPVGGYSGGLSGSPLQKPIVMTQRRGGASHDDR